MPTIKVSDNLVLEAWFQGDHPIDDSQVARLAQERLAIRVLSAAWRHGLDFSGPARYARPREVVWHA